MLRIALPSKGRLADDVRELFRDAGLEARGVGERALIASLGGLYEALFVRAQDIPELVADGAADAGVTGWDLICEADRPLAARLDLGFGNCRLVVAVKEESRLACADDIAAGTRIATCFPRIAARYFRDKGIDVVIVPISGSAEIAPHLGLADVVVDLVSTGSTLRMNGLREIDTVLGSTARLVTREAVQGEAAIGLDELTSALAGVLAARGKRYLMANVPRARLAEMRAILPGLKGPTVIDVLSGDSSVVAVHAVVDAEGVFRTIVALKRIGGEGILVTRIERLTP